jgi:hypothetical protein
VKIDVRRAVTAVTFVAETSSGQLHALAHGYLIGKRPHFAYSPMARFRMGMSGSAAGTDSSAGSIV